MVRYCTYTEFGKKNSHFEDSIFQIPHSKYFFTISFDCTKKKKKSSISIHIEFHVIKHTRLKKTLFQVRSNSITQIGNFFFTNHTRWRMHFFSTTKSQGDCHIPCKDTARRPSRRPATMYIAGLVREPVIITSSSWWWCVRRFFVVSKTPQQHWRCRGQDWPTSSAAEKSSPLFVSVSVSASSNASSACQNQKEREKGNE